MRTPTAADPSSAETSVTPDRAPTGLRVGALPTVVAAASAALGSYLLVASGLLGGVPALLLLVGVLVLVPSHRLLARRLSVNTALVLGWTQVLWWVEWPVRVNHAGVVIGLGVATAVAAGLRGAVLAPSASRSEVMFLLGAPLAAAAAVSRWLLADTPRQALEQLVPGVDNWAHFAMFQSLRSYGAVPEVLGASPDGSVWGYASYPKGFHTVVATMTEMFAPGLDGGIEALPAYLRGEAIVVVLGVLLVTASLLSLRGLRERPMVTLPAVVLMCSALLWEPGQKVFADGFVSFWLGAVAAGAALLVAVARSRPTLIDVAAVSGLIVLVCHCWLPLAVFVAPAGLLVLVPFLGAGWSRRRSVVALLLLTAGAIGSLKAVLMLFATVSVGSLVGQDGGYNAPALLPVLILMLSGCYALVALGPAQSRRGGEALLPRWQRLLLLLTPLAGLVMLGTLFVVQVQRQGETTYYFVKLLLGYELVLAVLVPAVVAVLVVTLLPPGGRRLPRVATSVLLSLAATVSFGVVTPAQAKLFDTSDGGTASLVPPYSRTGLAEGVLAAVGESTDRASVTTVYVALGPGNAGLLFYPDVWFHAVHASVTTLVMARMEPMRLGVSTPEEAARVVSTMLEKEPDLVFLVPERDAAAVRDGLAPRWASQIVAIPAG